MSRKNSNRATKTEILALARKRLEKTFNPRHNPAFKRLYVKVSPYDEEFGFWPVSIRARGVKNSVGDMEFHQAGEFKKCSYPEAANYIIIQANTLKK
jgi:hypothetical protein